MIEIYTKNHCLFCKEVKKTLKELGLIFTNYEITNNQQLTEEMEQRSKRKTVPQVFIFNQHIGGGVDFHQALERGDLSSLLAQLNH